MVMEAERRKASHGGGSSLWFVAWCYGAVVFLILISAGLVLGNIGGLWPERPLVSVEGEALRRWGLEGGRTCFAGGALSDGYFWRSIWLSLFTAGCTTLVAISFGLPLAWKMSRRDYSRWGRMLEGLETLFATVVVLPASSVGLCLIVLFQYGPLYELQRALGFQVMYSVLPGLVLAQLVLSMSLGVAAWKAAFDSVPRRFEDVAASLGAGEWRRFRDIAVPMAWSGLCAGTVLAFVRAMAEFGAVLLFCGTFSILPPERFPVLIRLLRLDRADIMSVASWIKMEHGELEYAYAFSFALIIATTLCTWWIHRLGGGGFIWRRARDGHG